MNNPAKIRTSIFRFGRISSVFRIAKLVIYNENASRKLNTKFNVVPLKEKGGGAGLSAGITASLPYMNMMKSSRFSNRLIPNASRKAVRYVSSDFFIYSYRSALIGSNDAAFFAGYQPKNMPVAAQTTNDMPIAGVLTT